MPENSLGNYRWLKLNEDERELDIESLQNKYLKQGLQEIGDVTSPQWSASAFRKYDDITFADYLRLQRASSDSIELIRLSLDLSGDGIENCSALAILRDMALSSSPLYFKIKGGNDLLPNAFAQRMKSLINYGSQVTQIEQNQREVRAKYVQGGKEKTVTADYLVFAIPFSVLKTIEINPSFSEKKKKAIEGMPYTSVTRVFLQSKRKFWHEKRMVPGYTSTDLPIQFSGDATLFQTGNRGILESYTAGEKARKMMNLSEDLRIALVIREMEKIYPGIQEYIEGGFTKCWDTDKWCLGAYSWFPKGYLSSSQTDISRPEGRVYFAGEHTSSWSGWMQGALQSGITAAQNINKLNGSSSLP